MTPKVCLCLPITRLIQIVVLAPTAHQPDAFVLPKNREILLIKEVKTEAVIYTLASNIIFIFIFFY
jgi:hypothetical protein